MIMESREYIIAGALVLLLGSLVLIEVTKPQETITIKETTAPIYSVVNSPTGYEIIELQPAITKTIRGDK
jgi:hypothetical protein